MYKHFYIVYVVYNEENTLFRSFLSAKKSIDHYKKYFSKNAKAELIICHNGCTDRSPEIAEKIKDKYSSDKLQITVMSSEKGMVKAQSKSIQYIAEKNKRSPIIFIDADSFIERKAISIILQQFEKHKKLKITGIQPRPISNIGLGFFKRFLANILNCRSYFPRSEISSVYLPEHHPYADIDPQKIGVDFEKSSKIYFHGRCFALKDYTIWDVPYNNIGEDTYLAASINDRFGSGHIRLIYDAAIFYYPMVSIKVYFKTYYRIYKDLSVFSDNDHVFNNYLYLSKTKLDWGYIFTLSFYWKTVFVLYFIMKSFFDFLFKCDFLFYEKNIDKIWSYNFKNQ